jgi:DNA-binding response OmpR family regulator
MSTIQLIEDDPDTVEIVRLYLKQEGYEVVVTQDGLEGLRLARELEPDLIILDLMLPKLDGLAICREIREESWVPIIMLTARVEEEDRLTGLNLGADDYISKPFSPKELVARVKAVLRRSDPDVVEREPQQFSFGGINVDLNLHEVKVRDKLIPLTPAETRLLTLLIREPRRVFTRQQIIDGVFGNDYESIDRTVDSHISNLRRKLRAGSGRYIQTIHGVGYRLSYD